MGLPTAAVLLVAWTWCTEPVAGRDVYVSNTVGSDRMDGSAARVEGGSHGPVRTLARALRLVEKGDHIVLDNSGKPYRESVCLSGDRHQGLRGKPLTIRGNGATLDGTAPVPPGAWQHFRGDVFRFRPGRLTHQQLLLHDKPARRRPVMVRRVLPELAPLEWTLMDGHIYFRVEDGRLPRDYDLKYSDRQTGITLYGVNHVRIMNLTVLGFALDGVNAHDGVRNTVLEGLACHTNGRSGISVGGASRVSVDRCRLGNNGQSQFRVEGYAAVHLNRTQIDATTTSGIVVDGGRLVIDGKPYTEDAADD
jgi:hypothetical protein